MVGSHNVVDYQLSEVICRRVLIMHQRLRHITGKRNLPSRVSLPVSLYGQDRSDGKPLYAHLLGITDNYCDILLNRILNYFYRRNRSEIRLDPVCNSLTE